MLQCQLPEARGGVGGSAVYVYTEGKPSRRMSEMARRFAERERLDWDPMARIRVVKGVGTAQELLAAVRQAHSAAGARSASNAGPPTKILVVDSVANVFRDVPDGAGGGQAGAAGGVQAGAMGERSSSMFEVALALKKLAAAHGLAVVTTNQVTDYVEDFASLNQGGGAGALVTSGRRVNPALGLAWASCVNHRVFVSRDTSGQARAGGETVGRRMRVVFSPFMGCAEVQYVVNDDGVRAAG